MKRLAALAAVTVAALAGVRWVRAQLDYIDNGAHQVPFETWPDGARKR